jgi:hypothetical protein
MSNHGTGNPYVIQPQTSVGTTPIVSIETQLGDRRIISYALEADDAATLDGTWLIEASNDFARDADVSMGNLKRPGKWFDVTAAFKRPDGTAVAAVAHGTAATRKQFATWAPASARAVRVTFTPSAGAGPVSVAVGGGSY